MFFNILVIEMTIRIVQKIYEGRLYATVGTGGPINYAEITLEEGNLRNDRVTIIKYCTAVNY